jgi:hypothetical protein
MTQTPSLVESRVEIIIDIGYHDLVPKMIVILSVHPLHLAQMAILIINQWEFKKDIPIKCC